MERIKGSRHNTLVNIVNEYMGSQSVLCNPTVMDKWFFGEIIVQRTVYAFATNPH